jgi:hypothetical protein
VNQVAGSGLRIHRQAHPRHLGGTLAQFLDQPDQSPIDSGDPFLNNLPFANGWSTAGDVLAGMTVELVIEEFQPQ